jgi:hypothetical protein
MSHSERSDNKKNDQNSKTPDYKNDRYPTDNFQEFKRFGVLAARKIVFRAVLIILF